MEEIKPPTSPAIEEKENNDKPKRPARIDAKQPIPFYLEFSLTMSKVVVVLTGIIVTGLSWYRGADILNIGLRSGSSMLGVGIFLWSINLVICNISIDIAKEYQKPTKNPDASSEDNVEPGIE